MSDERERVDLAESGLLWLINTSVFHPRGFALALDPETGLLYLLGDGKEPWFFEMSQKKRDAVFAAAQHTLRVRTSGDASGAPSDVEQLREDNTQLLHTLKQSGEKWKDNEVALDVAKEALDAIEFQNTSVEWARDVARDALAKIERLMGGRV